MNKISFDLYEKYIGCSGFSFDEGYSNTRRLQRLQQIMELVITERLSERQRIMLDCYYRQQLTMPEIARQLQVNKSTVSRTIARALHNIEKYIQYYPLR